MPGENTNRNEQKQAQQSQDGFDSIDTSAGPSTTNKAEDLKEGTRIHRYQILNLIGKGGMGAVYKAYDPELDRSIAIKMLTVVTQEGETASKPHARLMREAQALAKLSHPNVISVFDVGTYAGSVYIAMEYVKGKTLREWLRKEKPTHSEIVEVLVNAGRGLQSAHAEGIVHRDFKPENVIVGDKGQIKVLDFGLARATENEMPAASNAPTFIQEATSGENLLSAPLTQMGAYIGTTVYMAPEHFLMHELDEKTDQFSFCVTLFEALYGKRPFAGKTLTQLEENVTYGSIEIPEEVDVPEWIEAILLRGLSVSKANRFQSMEQLLDALKYDPVQESFERSRILKRRILFLVLFLFLFGLPIYFWYDLKYGSVNECKKQTSSEATRVWGNLPRSQIKESFLSANSSFAASSWERVSRIFDQYIEDWKNNRYILCEKASVDRQSDELFPQKIRCLKSRLVEFQHLADVFAQADEKIVVKAVKAASSLTSLSQCFDPDALTSKIELPDQKIASDVESHRDRLVAVRVLLNTGKYKEARLLAKSLLAPVKELGYRPLLAEAQCWAGWTEERIGKYTAAEELLQRSFWTAVESGHDKFMAQAANKLLWVVGYRLSRASEGLTWGQSAKIALVRLQWPLRLVGEWYDRMGYLFASLGKQQKAFEYRQKALETDEKVLGSEHPTVAIRRNNIGVMYWRIQDYDRALDHYQRALRITEKTLGPQHPDVAFSLSNIGLVFWKLGKYDKAIDHLQRALVMREELLGKEHPLTVWPLAGLGEVYRATKKWTQAIASFQRVTDICNKSSCYPEPLGMAYFGLARMIWYREHNYEKTLALAKQAGNIYAQSKKFEHEVEEIKAWTKKLPSKKAGLRAESLRRK